MRINRSMPEDVLIPVLGYPSVSEAVAWLPRAFGFTVRWQIEDHRAQLGVGRTAAVAITTGAVPERSDHVMIRVDDVDAAPSPGHGGRGSCQRSHGLYVRGA